MDLQGIALNKGVDKAKVRSKDNNALGEATLKRSHSKELSVVQNKMK
jgi:hypothetical protein